jgi:hypothetical protein
LQRGVAIDAAPSRFTSPRHRILKPPNLAARLPPLDPEADHLTVHLPPRADPEKADRLTLHLPAVEILKPNPSGFDSTAGTLKATQLTVHLPSPGS